MLIVHLLLRRQQEVQVVGVEVVVLLRLIFQAGQGVVVVHLFLVVEAVVEELMIVMVVQEEVGVVVVAHLELNVQVEEVVEGAVPRVLSDLLAVVVVEEGEQLEGPMMLAGVELQEVVVQVYDDL